MKLLGSLLMVLFWHIISGYTFHGTSLCNDPRCECLQATFGLGMNVTCTCRPQDKEALLTLDKGSLPPTTGLMSIEGCREVYMTAGAFSEKPYLTDVLINDAGGITFEPESGRNIAATKTPGIHIRRCRELRIHTRAFAENRSPFSLEITHCQNVHLHEAPFSRIRSLSISHVSRLHLSSNTFKLQTGTTTINTDRQVGKLQAENDDFKGDIRIGHSNITSGIPSSCFPSPLKRLELVNITTEEIRSDAFSSLNIEELILRDSKIGELAENSFQQPVLLTSLVIRSCSIRAIKGRALSSASTMFVLDDCDIGTIEYLGVSMHAAKSSIQNNRIDILRNSAFNMKSWNELEIRNNTMDTVEKNAFIDIGQPDLQAFDEGKVTVRFAVKDNTIRNAQVGSFVFSAQTVMPELENNIFLRDCDCDLNKWSAELTQAVRSTDIAEIGALRSNTSAETGALWIGSALFNNSFCRIATVESQCFMLSEPLLPMINYTENYCPKTRAAVDCISRAKSKTETSKPPAEEFDTQIGSVNQQPEVKKLDNDILLIIIFTVGLTVIILIAVISILLVKRRHQGKRRRSESRDCDGLVTCSPLLSLQDEAGAMRSGSISKMSIADYKTSLLPPPESELQTMSLTSQATDTTEVEDNAIETAIQPEIDSRTIDRGMQTDTKMMQTITDDFAEAVLAAIREKLEISPTYSEVRDKLFPKKHDDKKNQEPPTDTYTRPWLADYDVNKEPIYSSVIPKTPTTTEQPPTLKKGDSLTKAGLPPVKIDLTNKTADEILEALRIPPVNPPSSISSQSSDEPKSPSYFTYKKNKKDGELSDSEKKGPRKTWVLQDPPNKAKSPTRQTSPKWPPPGYDATLKPVETRPSSRKSSGALSPTRALTSPNAVRAASTSTSPPPKKDSRPAWRAGGSLGGSAAPPTKKPSKEDTPIIDTSTFVRKSNLKESDSPGASERRRSVRFSSDETGKVEPVLSDYQAPSDALSKAASPSKSDKNLPERPVVGTAPNMGEYSLPRDQIPSKQSLTYSEVSREVPITQRPLPKRPDSNEQVPVPGSSSGSENFYEQLTR